MDYVFVEPLYSDALEANQQAEPIMYVSEQQLGSVGEYLPTRAKPEGNFQFALYAAPSSALEANQQVIETLRAALERICDYANADYVPNVLFDKARAALLFAALTHTQPEPTRGQSNAEL